MLEIHLFVNPLGSRCYRCENDVLRVDQQLNTTVRYRFIPLFNMQTIQQTMHLYHLNPHSTTDRQRVVNVLNQLIMDYMAASFQGRKRGRQFLLLMQDALICHNQNYSIGLAQQIAQRAGLDIEMFLEDRQSDLAKRAHLQDQKIAAELGVTDTATAVVFDSDNDQDGVLISNFDYQTLIEAFHDHNLAIEQSPQQFAKQYQKHHHASFRLIEK